MAEMYELRDIEFFDDLKLLFEQQGYDFLPLQNQFKKSTPSGFFNIIVSAMHYDECIQFELYFGSRINIVEETIAPYSHGLKGYKEESNTCITNLGKYFGKRFYKLVAYNQEEVKDTGKYIRDFFEREGFAFLHSLNDMAKVEHAFNHRPMEESLLAFSHELRCFRGITLASLVQSHYLEKINQAYLYFMRQRRSPLIVQENYNRLVRFLNNTGIS